MASGFRDRPVAFLGFLGALLVAGAGGALLTGAWRDDGREAEHTARIEALEATVARVRARLAEAREGAPVLQGRAPGASPPLSPSDPMGLLVAPPPAAEATARAADGAEADAAASADGAAMPAEAEAAIRELVDEAVERKTAQMRALREKQPTIALFARTLELDEAQQAAAEEAIRRGQHAMQALLATPTEDGTVLLEELVEALARGMARPEEEGGRGRAIFARLLKERVPGTDRTYAEEAQAVKERLQETFRRDWRPEQYALYAAWELDPTRIRDVPDAPYKELERRIVERATQLGYDPPR